MGTTEPTEGGEENENASPLWWSSRSPVVWPAPALRSSELPSTSSWDTDVTLVCEKPYVQGIRAFGCGKCLPCITRRRSIWMHRLMLENLQHEHSAFVTLTYEDKHLPKTEDGLPTLVPRDLQLWLKRIRKQCAAINEQFKLRFFAVGEYGSQSERPHYHVALFGHPTCLKFQTDLRMGPGTCCSICSSVQKTWTFGSVHLGRIEPKSMNYICGYVLKRMTSPEDLRLGGRHPEFARMSLVPGIGAGAMDDAASVMMQYQLEDRVEDVPHSLDHGKRGRPLGRYLQGRLRERIGREKQAPVTEEKLQEMLALHARSVSSQGLSVGRQASLEAEGRIRQVRWTEENIGKKRGSL